MIIMRVFYRKQVKNTMEILVKQRTNSYLQKFEENEMKVAMVQKMKNDEYKARHHFETIKRMDKEENVKRIAKMQDYQRKKILEKIAADNDKAGRIRFL